MERRATTSCTTTARRMRASIPISSSDHFRSLRCSNMGNWLKRAVASSRWASGSRGAPSAALLAAPPATAASCPDPERRRYYYAPNTFKQLKIMKPVAAAGADLQRWHADDADLHQRPVADQPRMVLKGRRSARASSRSGTIFGRVLGGPTSSARGSSASRRLGYPPRLARFIGAYAEAVLAADHTNCRAPRHRHQDGDDLRFERHCNARSATIHAPGHVDGRVRRQRRRSLATASSPTSTTCTTAGQLRSKLVWSHDPLAALVPEGALAACESHGHVHFTNYDGAPRRRSPS